MNHGTPVEKIRGWVPVSDESIVDLGLGTPAQQRAAADRIEARSAAVRAAWRALPWWSRARWRVVARRSEAWHRIRQAASALRGVECERD